MTLLDVGAVYRLTRLITADDLTADLRDSIVRAAYLGAGRESLVLQALREQWDTDQLPSGAWGEYAQDDPWAPKVATLVTCRWCASVWVAFGVLAVRRLFPRMWRPVSWALTASAVAALLSRLED